VELPDGKLLTLWYEYKRSTAPAAQLTVVPRSVLRLARWSLAG
jgi:hypothetical protein